MAWSIAASVVSLVASYAISALTKPKDPSLQDNTLVSSADGQAIPELVGTDRVKGQIFWGLPLSKAKSHGKKGKKSAAGAAYVLHGEWAVLVCRGPVDAIRRIWANGKIIYDCTGTPLYDPINGKTLSSGAVDKYGAGSRRIYLGTETQMPDSVIEQNVNVNGNAAPAFRGLCYIGFSMDLADFSNQVPEIECEVTKAGITTFPVQAADFASQGVSGGLAGRVHGPARR